MEDLPMANKPGSLRMWMGTAQACERLGIHRDTLRRMRQAGTLQKGIHWKVKNPLAQRLTYLYHITNIEKLQSNVQTEIFPHEST